MRECSEAMEKLVEGRSLDFNLCIICQNQSADDLVENSTSHDKLFSSIEERTNYEDANLAELWSILKTLSAEDRVEKVLLCSQQINYARMIPIYISRQDRIPEGHRPPLIRIVHQRQLGGKQEPGSSFLCGRRQQHSRTSKPLDESVRWTSRDHAKCQRTGSFSLLLLN